MAQHQENERERSISIPPSLDSTNFRRSLRQERLRENQRRQKRDYTNNESSEKHSRKAKSQQSSRISHGSQDREMESDSNISEDSGMSRDPYAFCPPEMSSSKLPSLGNDLEDSYWSTFSNIDAIVHFKIIDLEHQASEKIAIPLRSLLERESEMRQLAIEQEIDQDRWDGSLLYQYVRSQEDTGLSSYEIAVTHGEPSGGKGNQNSVSGSVTTVQDKQTVPKWNHLIYSSLVPYFSTGRISVSDQASGPDILHMLEFFQIVYTPSLLNFQSFGSYLRVQLWGEYFGRREEMASWVIDVICSKAARKGVYFITSSKELGRPDDTVEYFVGSKRCEIFDGGLDLEEEMELDDVESSCALVHEFFSSDDNDYDNEDSVDAQLREDFRFYLQSSLNGMSVSFSMKEVNMVTKKGNGKKLFKTTETTVFRPVLHISCSYKKNKYIPPPPPIQSVAKSGQEDIESTKNKNKSLTTFGLGNQSVDFTEISSHVEKPTKQRNKSLTSFGLGDQSVDLTESSSHVENSTVGDISRISNTPSNVGRKLDKIQSKIRDLDKSLEDCSVLLGTKFSGSSTVRSTNQTQSKGHNFDAERKLKMGRESSRKKLSSRKSHNIPILHVISSGDDASYASTLSMDHNFTTIGTPTHSRKSHLKAVSPDTTAGSTINEQSYLSYSDSETRPHTLNTMSIDSKTHQKSSPRTVVTPEHSNNKSVTGKPDATREASMMEQVKSTIADMLGTGTAQGSNLSRSQSYNVHAEESEQPRIPPELVRALSLDGVDLGRLNPKDRTEFEKYIEKRQKYLSNKETDDLKSLDAENANWLWNIVKPDFTNSLFNSALCCVGSFTGPEMTTDVNDTNNLTSFNALSFKSNDPMVNNGENERTSSVSQQFSQLGMPPRRR